MTTPIILIHGAFHTGQCWDLLAPRLVERGLEPHPVTLSGHRGNPRAPSEVTMEVWGDDAIKRAEAIGRPCLLLGHSMGGKVISAAAERRPELFSGVIWLTAFAVPYGRTDAHVGPTIITPKMMEALGALEKQPDGSALFPTAMANEVFYNTCTPEIQAFAHQRFSPQPLGAMYEPFETSEARLGSVAKHYIECLQDAAVTIEGQRIQQSYMDFRSVHTLDTDHSPFYCQPAALADAIAAIAAD